MFTHEALSPAGTEVVCRSYCLCTQLLPRPTTLITGEEAPGGNPGEGGTGGGWWGRGWGTGRGRGGGCRGRGCDVNGTHVTEVRATAIQLIPLSAEIYKIILIDYLFE